jgi:hypothetical protein
VAVGGVAGPVLSAPGGAEMATVTDIGAQARPSAGYRQETLSAPGPVER